jgi:hypothetical protein
MVSAQAEELEVFLVKLTAQGSGVWEVGQQPALVDSTPALSE